MLCDDLLGELGEIGRSVTATIRAAEPAYGTVPLPEHEADVTEQQRRILVSIRDRRNPSGDDLAAAADLGRRRARQGVLVQEVIGAYHIGNRELWERIQAHGPASDLTEAATIMWRDVHEFTAALAEAHASTSRSLDATQIGLRHQFVSLLAGGDVDEQTARIARALDLRPEGKFVVVLVAKTNAAADDFGSALRPLPGEPDRVIAAGTRDGLVAVVLQSRMAERLVAQVSRKAGKDACLAVGLERPGLAGCAQSLRDARQVLTAAPNGSGVYRYQDHWLRATLFSEADSLRAMLGPAIKVAKQHPHLGETVVAYADSDMSAAATSAALSIHPNTTAYRLARWQTLTGWEVRTMSGLTASVLACWLVAAETGTSAGE
jgi:hypothetical protein